MPNTPSEGPREELPEAENPKGYDEYVSRGGTLTPPEFTLVWDTPSSIKLIHKAQEAGISGRVQQIIATSILKALPNDKRLESTLWLRTEAHALIPLQE